MGLMLPINNTLLATIYKGVIQITQTEVIQIILPAPTLTSTLSFSSLPTHIFITLSLHFPKCSHDPHYAL